MEQFIADSLEWEVTKTWNPFNSAKLLAHVERWKKIRRNRPIPAPVSVTIDPTNLCNFNCIWCNSRKVREERHNTIHARAIEKIPKVLNSWDLPDGVEAVCIAGGGEPLLNEQVGELILRCVYEGIQVGVVTNGSLIDSHIDALSQCTWVGISIDAGTPETFYTLKNVHHTTGYWSKIQRNIEILNDYAKTRECPLARNRPGNGITYKYLLYSQANIIEMYEAAKLAKELGCKNIHFRPAGTPWFSVGKSEFEFTEEDIKIFQTQIRRIRELESSDFNVYGITHKFDPRNFKRDNQFQRCYAIFMTAVIMPPIGEPVNQEAFTLGLCCDRRGDSNLELAANITHVGEVRSVWGSKLHWEIFDRIRVENCPRCTYQPHNQIYEDVILRDSMTYKFI